MYLQPGVHACGPPNEPRVRLQVGEQIALVIVVVTVAGSLHRRQSRGRECVQAVNVLFQRPEQDSAPHDGLHQTAVKRLEVLAVEGGLEDPIVVQVVELAQRNVRLKALVDLPDDLEVRPQFLQLVVQERDE